MQKRSRISLWIFPLVSPPGDRRKLPKIMLSHSPLGNTGLLQDSNFDYSFLTCTNTCHVIFITMELCSYVRWVHEFFEHSWVSGHARFMNPTKKKCCNSVAIKLWNFSASVYSFLAASNLAPGAFKKVDSREQSKQDGPTRVANQRLGFGSSRLDNSYSYLHPGSTSCCFPWRFHFHSFSY